MGRLSMWLRLMFVCLGELWERNVAELVASCRYPESYELHEDGNQQFELPWGVPTTKPTLPGSESPHGRRQRETGQGLEGRNGNELTARTTEGQ